MGAPKSSRFVQVCPRRPHTRTRFLPSLDSLWGVVHQLGWTCPVTVVYGQSLIRNPPGIDKVVTRQYQFPPDPGALGRRHLA